MSGEVVHRLGVAVGIVPVLMWSVRWLVRTRHRRRMRRRLAELSVREAPAPTPRLAFGGAARSWLAPVGVACAGWALVGGLTGVAVGLAGGVGMWRWQLRQEAAGTDTRAPGLAEAARQLPLAADLLAACIAAGAGPVVAAQAVGEALGGPVGDALARGAAEVRLGGEPGAAWRRLAAVPGAGGLARLLERADVSGLPAAAPVARLAAEARADWGRAATARARRAGVMVSAPVGLCFLPAFIAVGVLPVVIGLAGGVLGGGGD
ncbi:type II secretion system F family protein [Streptomyces lomondensis]|uniref:Membrane protein n=1 Tax=Streptomyces lomondensis TaxID=68229 RepID=A0ABQ2XE97_9ACTN|nr:type II secretion system F family protein [Streptomyces lomondensis]MCF0077783.1 type II secretion system F family protein [Streptomyces lomondensis]GGX12437.1 membrane protein [Streptomyces lomondensis]